MRCGSSGQIPSGEISFSLSTCVDGVGRLEGVVLVSRFGIRCRGRCGGRTGIEGIVGDIGYVVLGTTICSSAISINCLA